MNDTANGALTHTTQQLWRNDVDGYAIFNDEVPGESSYSFTYGHTKGYFAFDTNENGFWLSHSFPLFPVGPENSSKYLGLGGNAWTYAQSVICISVNAIALDSLAYKFLLNRPQVYDSKLNSGVAQNYDNITKLIGGGYSSAAICAYGDFPIEGASSGRTFRLFAKSTQWKNDLYSQCVAPAFNNTLWVETWIRGSAEGPACPEGGPQTLDVQSVNLGSGASWSETQDHSKWAIGLQNNVVCIGDINRMTTQFARGGGTTCVTDKKLFNEIKNAVNGVDSC